MMLKIIINKFNSMEGKTKNILKYGMLFSLFVCIISLLILLTYHFFTNPDLYYIGLSVFKLSLFLVVEFVVCALAVDTIRQQIF